MSHRRITYPRQLISPKCFDTNPLVGAPSRCHSHLKNRGFFHCQFHLDLHGLFEELCADSNTCRLFPNPMEHRQLSGSIVTERKFRNIATVLYLRHQSV
jgi:hypothetical protein